MYSGRNKRKRMKNVPLEKIMGAEASYCNISHRRDISIESKKCTALDCLLF